MNNLLRPCFCVYALCEPNSSKVRYVGKTSNLKGRFKRHLETKDERSHLYRWVKKLQKSGKNPEIKVLQECFSDAAAYEAEIYWISEYLSKGEKLCNKTKGGLGAVALGKRPGYWNRAISKSRKGVPWSKENKEILRDSHILLSPEQRAEIKILKKTNSLSTLAKIYGVSPGTINIAVHDYYYPNRKQDK